MTSSAPIDSPAPVCRSTIRLAGASTEYSSRTCGSPCTSAPLKLPDPPWCTTAEQVGSYKPSHRNFEVAFELIGLPRNRILHVAQSLFHDQVPAKELGLSTVWVNRRQGKAGSGATPPAAATPDLTVRDMATLADVALA